MTAGARTRVLVVDDSAFARKVLRLSLDADQRIEVVGTAHDGLDALEKLAELKPDVMTLDLMMPALDGVGVMRALQSLLEKPRVVLVTTAGEDSELAVEALSLGAVELVTKPTALASDRLYEVSGALVEAVIRASGARQPQVDIRRVSSGVVSRRNEVDLVVVGASTGGPHALTELVSRLPAHFPVPMAIALHIPGEYTAALARRLDGVGKVRVVEARQGLRFEPGVVVLARGGVHLSIERDGTQLISRISHEPRDATYYPSIDTLFSSAARACDGKVLGVVLTGMGDDGLLGSQQIVALGGQVINESEASSVVYGMPRAVAEAKLSSASASIEAMADEVMRCL